MKKYSSVVFLIALLTASANAQLVTWNRMVNAPYPFAIGAKGVIGDRFYCFGADIQGTTQRAQAFNILTEQWQVSTPPPYGICRYGCASTDSAIYLITSGTNPPYSIGTYVQKFTPTGGGPTGTWRLMQPYPVTLWAIAAAWDGGNFIYSAGGNNLSVQFGNAYKYDIANNTWTAIAPMPYPSSWCGAAFVHGKFYILGGQVTPNMCLEYDPVLNTWTTKTDAMNPMFFGSACTAFSEDFIYVITGGGISFPPSDVVQIYHPLTDTWITETSLPIVVGCNSTGFVPPNKIICAGGYAQNVVVANTYLGLGFPNGESSLEIAVSPVNPPITIPANGGSFQYNINVHNLTLQYRTFSVWNKLRDSADQYYDVFGPITRTLPGNANPTRILTQTVAGTIPSGTLYFISYVGGFPNIIADSSFFTITKSAVSDGGPWISESSVSGDVFDEYRANANPQQCILFGNYPNPFNPTTAISYQLPAKGFVNLSIYDISGKKVAELVNGIREASTHEVTFDGSGLASGVYLYRLEAGDYSAVQKMVLLK
jgi:hypothetical protein